MDAGKTGTNRVVQRPASNYVKEIRHLSQYFRNFAAERSSEKPKYISFAESIGTCRNWVSALFELQKIQRF